MPKKAARKTSGAVAVALEGYSIVVSHVALKVIAPRNSTADTCPPCQAWLRLLSSGEVGDGAVSGRAKGYNWGVANLPRAFLLKLITL